MITSAGRAAADGTLEVREVGLPFAETGDFRRGDGESPLAQGDGKILVVAVRIVPLLSVFPETHDVLHTVTMSVERHDYRWLRDPFRKKQIHRHMRVFGGTHHDFFSDVAAFIDTFYQPRFGWEKFGLKSQHLAEDLSSFGLPGPALGPGFRGKCILRGCRIVPFPQLIRRLELFLPITQPLFTSQCLRIVIVNYPVYSF